MPNLTLGSLRLVGARWLAGLAALLALPVFGRAIVSDSSDQLAAAGLAALLLVQPVRSAILGRAEAAERILLAATVSAMPALLLFAYRGFAWQTDIHMMFFAVLAVVAILADWRAIVAGAAIVAVHHLLFGLAMPSWVFQDEGSLARILFHAVILGIEAAALTWLCVRLVALLAAIESAQASRIATEETAAAERRAEAERLEKMVKEIGGGLSALAEGDLTHALTADFPPPYARIRQEYEEARVALSALIDAVTAGLGAIDTGSTEIARASEDLARRTESNAASLEETSAAVAQIDGRIRATAEAAGRTVSRADQAIATVSDGRSIADEAVQAMGRVSESAKGIDNVIEGLDKIAFQTRVLAMNAAVEAGRAGEAGRGVAVVADLVSALAMRAEEEAKRARDQLTVTQSEIVSAVDAVTKVDGALQDISGDVGEVHQLLGTMASDNQAQASAITQISAAIGSMDQATQQNAAMVEQTSAAARNLTSEVETLAEQAAQFRTGGGDAPRPRGRKAEAAPKHFVPARTRGQGAGYKSPVAALPSNGHAHGGADDWKDF
jgi:methyl-accepting chemotaxis protein